MHVCRSTCTCRLSLVVFIISNFYLFEIPEAARVKVFVPHEVLVRHDETSTSSPSQKSQDQAKKLSFGMTSR